MTNLLAHRRLLKLKNAEDNNELPNLLLCFATKEKKPKMTMC
jgi:hypothetical protein